jgi:type IV secretory pathway TraG/TraD family ATPase VirD4
MSSNCHVETGNQGLSCPQHSRPIGLSLNAMECEIFYRQADDETASFIERSLSRRSEYGRSETLHDGHVVSEGRSEQAVSLLTTRDSSALDLDDVIAFFSNRKPIRAKRMDWRAFPLLRQRRAIPPSTLSPLPVLSESPPPSPYRRDRGWPPTSIDPDEMN